SQELKTRRKLLHLPVVAFHDHWAGRREAFKQWMTGDFDCQRQMASFFAHPRMETGIQIGLSGFQRAKRLAFCAESHPDKLMAAAEAHHWKLAAAHRVLQRAEVFPVVLHPVRRVAADKEAFH